MDNSLESSDSRRPLADRMRPETLEELVGQEEVLGAGKPLREALQADKIGSILIYGPPGCGKTTLARLIAAHTRAHFQTLDAVLSGVPQIREALALAEKLWQRERKPFILFVDEIHRFNKTQQDSLLPHIETGRIRFVGATTENPFFAVNKALVSRSLIVPLKMLSREGLQELLHRALSDERGYGNRGLKIGEGVETHLLNLSSGDGRQLYNFLESAVETLKGTDLLTLEHVESTAQRRSLRYDKSGDDHYDHLSAFIKSIRGSAPDAALYWMNRMLSAGEEPRTLFRRMLISAAEDVGLADPNALRLTLSAAEAFDRVGMPEGMYLLSEACVYLSTAPKSNSLNAVFRAKEAVEKNQGEVPDKLKDPSRDKSRGHGKDYLYPHDFPGNWVSQSYLPSGLETLRFYHPGEWGYETKIREDMERRLELDSLLVDGFTEGGNLEIKKIVSGLALSWVQLEKDSLLLDLGGWFYRDLKRKYPASRIWCGFEENSKLVAGRQFCKYFDPRRRPELFLFKWNAEEKIKSHLNGIQPDVVFTAGKLPVARERVSEWVIQLSNRLAATTICVDTRLDPGETLAQWIESTGEGQEGQAWMKRLISTVETKGSKSRELLFERMFFPCENIFSKISLENWMGKNQNKIRGEDNRISTEEWEGLLSYVLSALAEKTLRWKREIRGWKSTPVKSS